MDEYQRSLSRPLLTIMSINIECLSLAKEELLAKMSEDISCDILCIQETHRDITMRRPKILGMQLAVERPHRQYGSAIFVRSGVAISATSFTEENNIEILSVELDSCTVSSLYKPPGADFYFTPPTNCHNHEAHFIVGDFNSHSCVWGYDEDDRNGEAVLTWADNSRMSLLHDSKLPPSFNSGRWKRGYNPDLIFVKESIIQQCIKRVLNPIPNTQHRPICYVAYAAIRPKSVPFRRRYNFNKANWTKFTETLEAAISDIEPSTENYDLFVEAVKRSSRLSVMIEPHGSATGKRGRKTPRESDTLEERERKRLRDIFAEPSDEDSFEGFTERMEEEVVSSEEDEMDWTRL
ncbi:uncharacterized protein LOC134296452 [Anolis carolinensis]|uniref:uncharacterized protein LOC134296452 n=1 Tax=Anolis carolinensis TaxID=28377 RepID=UPI002F2B4BEE